MTDEAPMTMTMREREAECSAEGVAAIARLVGEGRGPPVRVVRRAAAQVSKP